MSRRYVFDLEATGLLDHNSIDYHSLPYKLKDTFKVWCAVFIDEVTGAVVKYRPSEIDKVKDTMLKAKALIGHNIISYDLLVCKLYFGLDYRINEYDYTKCEIGGNTVEIVDTLILSQYLKPDRLGGHSLKAWGVRLGILKGDFGEDNEEAWAEFSEDMLDYNEQDVKVNIAIYRELMKEWGDWDHSAAFSMEQAINELVVRQEHIGFYFDQEKAQVALDDLNSKLQQIEQEVEPLLPKMKLPKTKMQSYCLPKRQVNKDDTLSATMQNWIKKHEAEVSENEYGEWVITAYGKTVVLPSDPNEPFVTHTPMQVSDQRQMKQYLVKLGWNPVVWEQRDITLKSGTKQKVSFEKYKEAVERYCTETASSTFKDYRLEFLKVDSVKEMYLKLIHSDITRPVRVMTAPKYTIDQDKTICPYLAKLGTKVEWVEKVVLWLTYRHRRNMLKSPNGTGLMTHPRLEVDGRVPTGAVVTGTNTYRFKHRVCVNIPRPSSVYGAEIRELFGCGEGFLQIGCDAASLEGRVQGHYCYPYTDGKSLAATLIAEKPNDIHTVRAKALGISRDEAKAIGYACLPIDTTEVLTKDGWKRYNEVNVGDLVLSYNTDKQVSEWKPVTNTYHFTEAEVINLKHKHGFSIESTQDHVWFTKRRTGRDSTRRYVYDNSITADLTSEQSIITSARLSSEGNTVSPDQAELVGWLLSDGYFKWSKDTGRTSSSKGVKRGVVGGITQKKSKFYYEIKDLLDRVGVKYYEYAYGGNSEEIVIASSELRDFLDSVMEYRANKYEYDWLKFVLELSPESLERFAYAFYLAEGCTKGVDNFYENKTKILSQNEGVLLEVLQVVGHLLGFRTIVSKNYKSGGTCKDVKWLNKNHTSMQRVTKSNRITDVFCLEVADNHSFTIRQGNTVTLTGNCLYGAQPKKLQSMLGCTLKEAESLYKEFWESTPALLELKQKVEQYWIKNGKRFLKGIDGRKINTRSQHSLLNALFQSAGIILMKWAAIWLDRELEDRGLLFRPFDSDSWKGKAAQMQHYHDEYQFKVCPSLVEDGKSEVGDLMEQAIEKAGEILNMRVAFAGEAMVGTNWKECH